LILIGTENNPLLVRMLLLGVFFWSRRSGGDFSREVRIGMLLQHHYGSPGVSLCCGNDELSMAAEPQKQRLISKNL